MNHNVIAYIIYLLVTIYVIIAVGNILHKNGRPFLLNVFHGNSTLADSINNILLAGYYLVNIGYCIVTIKGWEKINTEQQLTEVLSFKIGSIVFLLGLMHLFNIMILFITEKKHGKTNNNNLKNQQS